MNGEPSAETAADRAAPTTGAAAYASEVILRAAWFPALVFFGHLFLYFVVRLYDRLPAFDLVTHFAGGAAIAYFSSGALRIAERRGIISPLDAVVRALLVFTLTVTAAVFWEFGEYLFDSVFGTRIQVDLLDTLSDMAMGVFGGLCYLFIGRLAAGRTSRAA